MCDESLKWKLDGIKLRLEEIRDEQLTLELEKRRLINYAREIDPHWQRRLPDGSLNPEAGSWAKEKPWNM